MKDTKKLKKLGTRRTQINAKSDWEALSGDTQILNKPSLGVYNLDGGRASSTFGAVTNIDGGGASL